MMWYKLSKIRDVNFGKVSSIKIFITNQHVDQMIFFYLIYYTKTFKII